MQSQVAYKKLKRYIDIDQSVVAHVSLYNGEQRLRIGPVAALNSSHVIIYDAGKGFRTTPLELVHSIQPYGFPRKPFAPMVGFIKRLIGRGE